MRRTLVAVAVIAVLAGVTYLAVAAPEAGAMADKAGKDCRIGRMCPRHMMMGKLMGGREMVATSDGGVVILMGTKLTKYDANLAIVKEVEVKCDHEGMMKKMKEMCDKCPMCTKTDELPVVAPAAPATSD